MVKYKATININRSTWDMFRDYCANKDTTATAQVTAFIETALLQDGFEVESSEQWENSPILLKELLFQVTQHSEEYIKREFKQIGSVLEGRIEQWIESKKLTETDRQTTVQADGTETDTQTIVQTDETRAIFTDKDVAKLEGLAVSTVCRYRKGSRTAPLDFMERWQVCPRDPLRWVRF